LQGNCPLNDVEAAIKSALIAALSAQSKDAEEKGTRNVPEQYLQSLWDRIDERDKKIEELEAQLQVGKHWRDSLSPTIEVRTGSIGDTTLAAAMMHKDAEIKQYQQQIEELTAQLQDTVLLRTDIINCSQIEIDRLVRLNEQLHKELDGQIQIAQEFSEQLYSARAQLQEWKGHYSHVYNTLQAAELDCQCRKEEIERLTAQLNSAKSEAWVSVEERLPESNKPILIRWINDNGKSRTSIGFYAAKHTVEYMDDESRDGYGDYSEEKDEYYYPEGFHENPIEIPYTSHLSKVTHWMPLPWIGLVS
jgi:chromosome segregation ATPase